MARRPPLILVPLHDREEFVGPCLDSIREKAGGEFELALVPNGCSFDPTPYLTGATYVDIIEEPLGPPAARNIGLRHRKEGQDLISVDSDIVFLTDGWLPKLRKSLYSRPDFGAITPVIGNPGPPYFHNMAPGQGIQEIGALPVGARFVKGEVMDQLGYFRVLGNPYGGEDLDQDARIKALGKVLAYDTDVEVSHPGIPSDDTWKRQQLEIVIPRLKQWEQAYEQGRFLYNPGNEYIPDNNPRWVTAGTEDVYTMGSFLPALKQAVEATTGPILELGTGLHSTPYLDEISKTGRLVVSYERHPRWLKLAKERLESEKHWVVEDIPFGMEFDVALVDCETDTRVPYIKKLREDVGTFVVHDTEDPERAPYGFGTILDSFKHRKDFGDVPRTTVLSDKEMV